MSRTTVQIPESADLAAIEQQIRARIEKLSYLPTTVSVAMKFIELGKNLEAEPSDYAKVISCDSSLSSKLLALANSPWFGVRNKVTNIKLAVNLLGLGTVRTLAISYCMAGLHNELGLSADESRMFWEASLLKAVAAKRFAATIDPKLADEAFVAGMFQDVALPLIYSITKDSYVDLLGDSSIGWESQLVREREFLGMDHTEIGRMVAQKLEVPEMYVDAVAFHHDHERLSEFLENDTLIEAVHVASLFPPLLDSWNSEDADAVCQLLAEGPVPEPTTFLEDVQEEFNKMYHFFEDADAPEGRLAELITQAAREGADSTTYLVRTVNELMQEAVSVGKEMNLLAHLHSELEDKATHDSLTQVLNREGFISQAKDAVARATRYGMGLALVYLDIDKFKSVNDQLGHDYGDRALKNTAAGLREAARKQDLVGRLGGDEFVLLLQDCQEADARVVVQRLLDRVVADPIKRGDKAIQISLSAGLLYLSSMAKVSSFDDLLTTADELMYQAKQAGGNQIKHQVV